MSKKDLALQSALALFNEHGTAHVSTNHIAEHAGISPGNLYYHFSNKKHIVRALYDVMVDEWTEQVYEVFEQKDLSTAMFEDFVLGHYKMLWKYRYFSREMVVLIQNDSILATRHFDVFEKRFERLKKMLLSAESIGLLDFGSDSDVIKKTLTIILVLSNQFLIHLESVGSEVNEDKFQSGVALVMHIVAPYMSK